jgi:dihydrodipicolinate synthase/N-acetylneuraminate lyase
MTPAKSPTDISALRTRLGEGLVIPAHPLALRADRRLDEKHQRALTRYYVAAGAGGLAVGVHTTQFAIREPARGLYRPVLELAIETASEAAGKHAAETHPVMIAGICGATDRAVAEAETARELGYDAGLLSLGGLDQLTDDELVVHSRAVADVLPIFGFYLQPAVGGRVLELSFWRLFCEIENLVAIKVAPFNRYRTLDVARAVVEMGRGTDIHLYTGNDDNIVVDLLSRYTWAGKSAPMVGGLLGQWAVGTKRAVEHLEAIKCWRASTDVPTNAFVLAFELADANAALFDAANGFRGSIAGIMDVLTRQRLVRGRWCLDPNEDLSHGQEAEISRVLDSYPHLFDDDFIAKHLDAWLA